MKQSAALGMAEITLHAAPVAPPSVQEQCGADNDVAVVYQACCAVPVQS